MKTLISVLLVLFLSGKLYPQSLDFSLQNAVISLDYKDSIHNYHFGTGVLLGVSKEFNGRFFLITAKHVFTSIVNNSNGRVFTRLEYGDSIIKPFKVVKCEIDLSSPGVFFLTSDSISDIVAIDITSGIKLDNSINSLKVKIRGVPYSLLKKTTDKIYVPQTVILAGFPQNNDGKNLKGQYSEYIIHRFGIISAVIDDEFTGQIGKKYLINTITQTGDSGSPVFLFSYSPFANNDDFKLIGIHTGSYFQGLSICEPIDDIILSIKTYLEILKKQ